MAKSLQDLVREKREKIAASRGKDRPIKPSPGKNRYRLLPSWREGEDQLFFREWGQHWIKGTNEKGEQKVLAVFNCDAATHDKRCEVCEAIQNAASTLADDSLINLVKEGAASERILFNALHLDGDKKMVPQVLELTKTTADQVLSIFQEYGEDMLKPDGGLDLIIERTGSGFDTKYSVMPAAKSVKISTSVLKELNDLDAYVMDTDENRNKALTAIGVVTGRPPMLSAGGGAAAPALAGPKKDPVEIEGTAEEVNEDDIPFDVDDAPAEEPEKASEETVAAAAVTEDDLEKMLADLD